MSPDEESREHAYFRAVEDAFIRLRGAPFLLSPEDWRVASGWQAAGVPLDLVEQVLERILREREEAEKGKTRRIRGLRYFDSAVTAAWKGRREVAGDEKAREAAPIAVPERLAALAAALPSSLPRREQWAREVSAVSGATHEVENELARIDREMLADASTRLEPEQRKVLQARVDAGLERVSDRLGESDLREASLRLERQILRRMLGLPLLSLFSPQAQSGDSSES